MQKFTSLFALYFLALALPGQILASLSIPLPLESGEYATGDMISKAFPTEESIQSIMGNEDKDLHYLRFGRAGPAPPTKGVANNKDTPKSAKMARFIIKPGPEAGSIVVSTTDGENGGKIQTSHSRLKRNTMAQFLARPSRRDPKMDFFARPVRAEPARQQNSGNTWSRQTRARAQMLNNFLSRPTKRDGMRLNDFLTRPTRMEATRRASLSNFLVRPTRDKEEARDVFPASLGDGDYEEMF